MPRSRLLFVGFALASALGCAPRAPKADASLATSTPVAVPPRPVAPKKPGLSQVDYPVVARWQINPTIVGEPISGQIGGLPIGEELGTVTIHVCPLKEWQRAQHQKRPPIPAQTVVVDLTHPEGTQFRFGDSPELVGPLMLYATKTGRVSLDPVLVRPRPGGPADRTGPADGVATSDIGAPVDAQGAPFNP